jgi:hypothetical protein
MMSVDDFVITPVAVERRLFQLGKELDSAHDDLHSAELEYMLSKNACEIALAAARMKLRKRHLEAGVKITVQEVEDQALLQTQDEQMRLAVAEATVRSARANNARIKVQIDIARSIGTSVRASMEVT